MIDKNEYNNFFIANLHFLLKKAQVKSTTTFFIVAYLRFKFVSFKVFDYSADSSDSSDSSVVSSDSDESDSSSPSSVHAATSPPLLASANFSATSSVWYNSTTLANNLLSSLSPFTAIMFLLLCGKSA